MLWLKPRLEKEKEKIWTWRLVEDSAQSSESISRSSVHLTGFPLLDLTWEAMWTRACAVSPDAEGFAPPKIMYIIWNLSTEDLGRENWKWWTGGRIWDEPEPRDPELVILVADLRDLMYWIRLNQDCMRKFVYVLSRHPRTCEWMRQWGCRRILDLIGEVVENKIEDELNGRIWEWISRYLLRNA